MQLDHEIEAVKARLAKHLGQDVERALQRINSPTRSEQREAVERAGEAFKQVGKALSAVAAAMSAATSAFIKAVSTIPVQHQAGEGAE